MSNVVLRDWEAADLKRGDAKAHPTPEPIQTKFTYDTAAVLHAVTAHAEHVIAGTLTAEMKRSWAHEHHGLFSFPSANEIADHIEHSARFKKSTAELVGFVLGSARVKAGLR